MTVDGLPDLDELQVKGCPRGFQDRKGGGHDLGSNAVSRRHHDGHGFSPAPHHSAFPRDFFQGRSSPDRSASMVPQASPGQHTDGPGPPQAPCPQPSRSMWGNRRVHRPRTLQSGVGRPGSSRTADFPWEERYGKNLRGTDTQGQVAGVRQKGGSCPTGGGLGDPVQGGFPAGSSFSASWVHLACCDFRTSRPLHKQASSVTEGEAEPRGPRLWLGLFSLTSPNGLRTAHHPTPPRSSSAEGR